MLALTLREALPLDRLTDGVLALRQLGLRRPLEIAARALRPELEQFFQRGESVACGRGRILTEGSEQPRARRAARQARTRTTA